MPRDDSTTILAATSFPPEMAPSYHQDCWAANHLFGFLEANVDAIVAASSTHDVMTQAKHFVCSTFKLFEDPMSATQNKEVAFRARSRLQTRCLSSKCASASGCATKRWSVLTQTIHPQRHIFSVGAHSCTQCFICIWVAQDLRVDQLTVSKKRECSHEVKVDCIIHLLAHTWRCIARTLQSQST